MRRVRSQSHFLRQLGVHDMDRKRTAELRSVSVHVGDNNRELDLVQAQDGLPK